MSEDTQDKPVASVLNFAEARARKELAAQQVVEAAVEVDPKAGQTVELADFISVGFAGYISALGFTPHVVVVQPEDGDWRVPPGAVKGGVITLNISVEATSNLTYDGLRWSFNARFNGKSFPIMFRSRDIAVVYALEQPSCQIVFKEPVVAPVATATDEVEPQQPT